MRRFKLKRWIAFLLVALLVTVNLSGFTALADGESTEESGGNEETFMYGSEQGDSIMNPDVPDEIADDPDDNPYGHAQGESFALEYPIQSDGLFFYSSKSNSGEVDASFYEDYVGSESAKLRDDSNWDYTTNKDLSAAYAANAKDNHYESYYVLQTLAFDALNDGQDTFIAFLGVGNVNGKKQVGVWIYSTVHNIVSDVYVLGEMSYISDTSAGTYLQRLKSIFSMTAGDYDGDGIDTLVVYGAVDAGPTLVTLVADTGETGAIRLEETASVEVSDSSISKMLQPLYLENWEKFQVTETYFEHVLRNASEIDNVTVQFQNLGFRGRIKDEASPNGKNRLAASLASGDVNGDGVDDLVVVSSFYNYDSTEMYYSHLVDYNATDEGHSGDPNRIFPKEGIYKPYLAVSLGNTSYSDKQILERNGGSADYVVGKEIHMDYSHHLTDYYHGYQSLCVPTVTIGTVSDNGKNSIILGGYLKYIEYDGDARTGWFNKIIYDFGCASIITYGYSGNALSLGASGVSTMTVAGSGEGVFLTRENAGEIAHTKLLPEPVPLQVAAVNLRGNATNSQQSIFLDGAFYSSNGAEILEDCRASVLISDVATMYQGKVPSGYVPFVRTFDNLSTINDFNQGEIGHGSLALSVVVGFRNNNDVTKPILYCSYGAIVSPRQSGDQWVCKTTYDKPDQLLSDSGEVFSLSGNAFNASFCRGGYKESGYKLRFAAKYYLYTNPDILAVLQAAPYFGELGKMPGTTTYKLSHSFSTAHTDSSSMSGSIYEVVSVNAEFATASVKYGYACSTKDWTTDTYKTTYESSFTAAAYDTIVLYRIPIICYAYDLWDPEANNGQGAWLEEYLAASYLGEPAYEQMSVKDYNSFARINAGSVFSHR